MPPRIYLDNAATSWPKPPEVVEAVRKYMTECGAPAGRSAYASAQQVERDVADARRAVARLLRADDPRQVIFTANGTDSLNLALHGLLRGGDHVVTTVLEHNSVLRPLHALQSSGVEVEHVRCGANTIVDPADIRSAIRPNTKLIALVHASNVTGSVQPFEEVYEIARKHDVPVLLDAAQSLGHLPIEVAGRSGLLVAAPGHKALGGPLGVGILYASPDVPLAPTRQGGTGTKSQEPQQPDSWPDRFESGNHNVPAILGLAAGIRFADQHPHELQSLHAKLVAGLDTVAGISIYGSPDERVGVVSFNVAGWQAQEVAAMLDAAHAIEARAGYLCAPLVHPLLGSEAGGVVRLSLGRFNTADQVNLAVAALTEIAASSASF